MICGKNKSLQFFRLMLILCSFIKQSKLEKADVLEITVQHMEGLQRGLGPGKTIKCTFDLSEVVL